MSSHFTVVYDACDIYLTPLCECKMALLSMRRRSSIDAAFHVIAQEEQRRKIDMKSPLTAENLFSEMKRMPTKERVNIFSPVTNNAFRDNDYAHDQVFGHLRSEPFSAADAAQYLEVSVPTLRRLVQSGKLVPSHVVGRNQMFSTQTLRAFKRTRG
ncbi:MAG: helix-turn-helix domain-containing protein [Burkholderiales bacterium]